MGRIPCHHSLGPADLHGRPHVTPRFRASIPGIRLEAVEALEEGTSHRKADQRMMCLPRAEAARGTTL
jgi:hypothetical protein